MTLGKKLQQTTLKNRRCHNARMILTQVFEFLAFIIMQKFSNAFLISMGPKTNSLIIVAFMLYVEIVESDNYFMFQMDENMDDLVIEDSILSSLSVESLSKCASTCTQNKKCHSFAFNDDIDQCKTYSVFNRQALPGSPTISVGWRHYTVKHAGWYIK